MVEKNELRFGTGGVPLSAESRDAMAGIRRIHELGLKHLELEFVYGVRMQAEKAVEVGELAQELGVTLSIHGPYYINLNSPEPAKRDASRERILDSCRIGHLLGAKSVCFHAAFNLGQQPEQVFDHVLSEMILIEQNLFDEGIDDLFLAPELTGKPTQFGDLDELIELSKNLKITRLCIDFAHYYARSIGSYNSYEDFLEVIKKIRAGLGEVVTENLHMHFSGIKYTAKGERKHEILAETEFNWKKMLTALKHQNVGGYLVCESPNLEEDALIAKEYYDKQ